MKRLLFAAFALILVGAGCSGGGSGTTQTQADWWLSFDLPDGWVMVDHYGGGEESMPTADTIAARSTDVVIQSTDVPISVDGEVADSWETYVDSDYAYIRAFRYTTLRPVPDDAVDLGNGFYRDDNWTNGTGYWFPQEFGNYLFTIELDGEDYSEEQALEVIFTAQEHDLSDQL